MTKDETLLMFDDSPREPARYEPSSDWKPTTIQERFEAFDAANPQVYRAFKGFALQLLNAGRRRYSSDAVLQRVRWHFAIETTGSDPYRINDHYSSRYARKLIAEDSRFDGFFELRELHTA
jgi:hypothetical protein